MRNLQFLSGLGNPEHYSPGFQCLTADAQLKEGMENHTLILEDLSNGKTLIRQREGEKWFVKVGSFGNREQTMLMGAICGDVAGSVYEWNNIKTILPEDQLIHPQGMLTDDSIMTLAVADGIRLALEKLPKNWMESPLHRRTVYDELIRSLRSFGRKYPNAGYGGSFRRWLKTSHPKPYNSWGNGSAMRASYAGWVARSLAEAETLAELSAIITHDHPEGIKGAKVVAGMIYLLRTGASKEKALDYARNFYNLDFTLDEIRPGYRFDVSCQGSVPQAIRAFAEGDSFSEVLALAISIGGDSDTIAAIAGSVAEVIYPIPQQIRSQVVRKMDDFQKQVYMDAIDFAWRYQVP